MSAPSSEDPSYEYLFQHRLLLTVHTKEQVMSSNTDTGHVLTALRRSGDQTLYQQNE